MLLFPHCSTANVIFLTSTFQNDQDGSQTPATVLRSFITHTHIMYHILTEEKLKRGFEGNKEYLHVMCPHCQKCVINYLSIEMYQVEVQ